MAIVAPDRAPLTYAGLGRAFEAVARALADAGYRRRSRLAIALPAGPEFAIAVLAVGRVAACAPLNQLLEQETLVDLLRAMRIDALIVGEGVDTPAVRAARHVGVALVHLRPVLHGEAGAFELVADPRSTGVPREATEPDDIAFFSHTAGTTSRPKVVPYEQWRAAEAAYNRAVSGELNESDRVLLLTPLHSLGAIRRSLLPPLLVGGSVVCPAKADAKSLVDILQDLEPTQYVASPATHIALLEEFLRRTVRPKHSLRLIYSTYADMPAAVHQQLERAFGVPLLLSYGMTETGNIAQSPLPPQRTPIGSSGRVGRAEVAVADEAGRTLGPDEQGEIQVRGPEVFGGYDNDVEANRQAFRDGWFRTGDLGRIDRDGFVYLEGRIKDLINRGGAKISPQEVEVALIQHAAVREAAAFAIPHPTLGEDVAAAVVLRTAASIGGGELRRHARSRLAGYKVPVRIIEVGQLPRTSLGKVDRRALAKLAAAPAGFDSPANEGEARIALIFAEVLDVPRVGRNDGFFDLGGDSLRAMRVLTRVEEVFGVSVLLDVLFDHPTVAEFAAGVHRLQSRRGESGQRASLP